MLHPYVEFATDMESDAGDAGIVPITEDDLYEAERAAVLEIANHRYVQHVRVDGRDHEGTLVVAYEEAPGSGVMPYEILYVSPKGKVAEAMTNQPTYHRMFREMVEDVKHQAHAGHGDD